jgi:hypothetical protein
VRSPRLRSHAIPAGCKGVFKDRTA